MIAVLATAAGQAVHPPTAQAITRKALLHERLLILQGYLERYANEHYSRYPAPEAVRPDGPLPAPLWPRNPWTGAPMRAGSGVGDFTYTPGSRLLSYRLVGHYPGGSIVLSRRVPYARKMQNDHRTREQVDFIRQLVQQWARAHGGLYPPVREVAVDGSVGQQSGYRYWPHNVWTHQPIAVSRNWGDFSYTVNAERDGFSLRAHFSRGGGVTLTGAYATSPWREALLALQDEIAARNAEILEGYVREWALLHEGVLPAPADLVPGGPVATAFGEWPVDPFGNEPLRQGDGPGQFVYTAGPGPQYTIVMHLSGGSVTIAGSVPPLPERSDRYSSGSNMSFSTPHSGQTQSSGRSSNWVPGSMPPSGSPTSGSYR